MGNPTNEPQQYGEWLRAQGGNKMGSLKVGPAKAAVTPTNPQDSGETRQSTAPKEEESWRQDSVRQNQVAENFLGKKKADVTLPGVSVNGDGSFLEEATQIQIQKSKVKSARQEWVGTHDRRVEKGGMESYVFEDNVESVGSDEWGPQTNKWAEQNREQQEVTSPMKTQNGPNEEMYTNMKVKRPKQRRVNGRNWQEEN